MGWPHHVRLRVSATVFSRKVNGAATHALVIGVGHYPHLPGGVAKKKFPNPEGMGQLSSPPESARAVAQWLIENYVSPGRPLASVALLTSEKAPKQFKFQPPGQAAKSVATTMASMADIESAILDWHKLGNANPDNLILFYFCGHGIAAGFDLSLLMSDFGQQPQAPLDGALDFRKFHANMDECSARHQCYFIDACRTGSELLRKNQGYAGKPVIQWTGTGTNPNGQTRRGPVFFSTLADTKAYSRPGKVSLFTDALLETLAGAGSGDETGTWEVKTARVAEALEYLMRQASEALRMPQAQIPSQDSFAQVPLNTLVMPSIPVWVRVEPPLVQALATLRCQGGAINAKRAPKKEPWRLTVTPGKYSFYADFKSTNMKATPYVDEIVHPPFWAKPLKP